MTKTNKIFYTFLTVAVLCFSFGTVAFAANPTVNAGPDIYLTTGQTTTLQGSGYDPNGYTLNYYWTCTGGNLIATTIAQPVYSAPYSYNNAKGEYICTLTVINTYGVYSSDSMTVYVNSNSSYTTATVDTTYATYISNFQATLNGTLKNINSYQTNNVYFQWGTTTNYGQETYHQLLGYSQTFMQTVGDLVAGTTYHYRAVAKGPYGTIYGQDMTFTTSGTGTGTANGSLITNKQVINLSSGALVWSSTANAIPSDVLSFTITLQANGQDVHNVVVKDILPANLIYKGNLKINNSIYTGDITSGINIGTIPTGQTTTINYQAQVGPATNFNLGTSTLTNNAIITSTEGGTKTISSTITVNKSLVYGASFIATGLTNYLLTDSFLLPLLLLLAGAWILFSGEAEMFVAKLKAKIKR